MSLAKSDVLVQLSNLSGFAQLGFNGDPNARSDATYDCRPSFGTGRHLLKVIGVNCFPQLLAKHSALVLDISEEQLFGRGQECLVEPLLEAFYIVAGVQALGELCVYLDPSRFQDRYDA